MKRIRLAAPTLLVYWAMLLVGIALYGLTASSATTLRSIAIGALAGTVMGNVLALRDVRGSMAAVFIFFSMLWVTSVIPHELVGSHLWMAYLPASICGYWSLGDREALAAFWFPTMVWMLSILDRTGTRALDAGGIAFVCLLGVLFIIFLRAREARRATLWQSYAAVPLATARPPQLLREAPGRHLARFAWTALVGGAAIALTAWIAPHLWQLETSHAGHTSQTGAPINTTGQVVGYGDSAETQLPCCTLDPQSDIERTRVKEYFDLGRGHDTSEGDDEQPQCRRCDIEDTAAEYTSGKPEMVDTEVTGEPVDGVPVEGAPVEPTNDAVGQVVVTGGSPSGTITGTSGVTNGTVVHGNTVVAGTTIKHGTTVNHGTTPSTYTPPTVTSPPVVSPPVTSPTVTKPSTPPPSSPPVAAPPSWVPPNAPAAVATNDTPIDHGAEPAANTPTPSVETSPTPPSSPHLSANVAPQPNTTAPMAPQSDSHIGWDILRILGLLGVAALVLQLVALALRPIRRAITLRHLRRPFWTETVDQRVSNAWQLALVGLRDAGWCASSAEAPRQYAARVGVAGLERCAVILERARHGLGIDADDLTEMNAAADEAYRAARSDLGAAARVAAQIRWPLA